MTKPKTEVYEMVGGNEIGVVRMPEDDERWWAIVADHAIENEWLYNLDYATEADPSLIDEHHYYQPDAVAAWVRVHVKPPNWRWCAFRLRPVEERDDDWGHSDFLTAKERPNRTWWRGAVIDLLPSVNTEEGR